MQPSETSLPLAIRSMPSSLSQPVFLEDRLRAAVAAAFQFPPPPPAAEVLRSWADLRHPSADPPRLLAALRSLSTYRASLRISDSQVKLLLSFLSADDVSPRLSADSLPLLFSLISSYIRTSPRPSPPILLSVLSLSSSFPPIPHSVLLLGVLAASPALPDASFPPCLDRLCSLLDPTLPALLHDSNLLPEFLAGVGYGISRAEDDRRLVRILDSLFRTWDSAAGGLRSSLFHGLMILSLSEWCATGFMLSNSWSRIESLHRGASVDRCKSRGESAPFLVLMVSAGVLLAFRSNGVEISPLLGKSLEVSISFVAGSIISKSGSDSDADASDDSGVLLQCLAVALAWSGPIASDASVLRCLCLALLNEIFPLHFVTAMSLDSENHHVATNKVKEHLNGILFKQAGAVTRVFCNQYAASDDFTKETVEKHLWDYSLELYSNLRLAVLVHRGKSEELLASFEKIAEATFLMIVVFAAEVSKHKLNSKTSNEFRPEVSSRILVTFSCIEYLRRVRLPEYTEAVRRAVLTIQENAPSCVSFVESMPPYSELTKSQERMRYVWTQDEVQAARISFYLRVLPACISLVPTAMFGERIAATMFLYMQHPNEKVIRASHSVFVSFVSSSKDSDQDDRNALKEQLVFYYMRRALEVYPQINSFDGLASGVTALVRHLPAGSPSIFYCVHSLVEKTSELCRGAMSEDPTMWKNWEGNSGPPKKAIDLLLRVIYLIDIQALPYLLKRLAELIIQLPKDGRNALLDEMYSQVAESDDATRKPVLVSWLQSLSYLCSQKTPPSIGKPDKHGSSVASQENLSFIRGIAKL